MTNKKQQSERPAVTMSERVEAMDAILNEIDKHLEAGIPLPQSVHIAKMDMSSSSNLLKVRIKQAPDPINPPKKPKKGSGTKVKKA